MAAPTQPSKDTDLAAEKQRFEEEARRRKLEEQKAKGQGAGSLSQVSDGTSQRTRRSIAASLSANQGKAAHESLLSQAIMLTKARQKLVALKIPAAELSPGTPPQQVRYSTSDAQAEADPADDQPSQSHYSHSDAQQQRRDVSANSNSKS